MQEMIEYIRVHAKYDKRGNRLSRGNPVGAVVVQREGNQLNFGWSQCMEGDRYDRQEALRRARARCSQRIDLNTVPPRVRKALLKIKDRAERWWGGQ